MLALHEIPHLHQHISHLIMGNVELVHVVKCCGIKGQAYNSAFITTNNPQQISTNTIFCLEGQLQYHGIASLCLGKTYQAPFHW